MAQPIAVEQHFLELVNRARPNPAADAARLGIGISDFAPAAGDRLDLGVLFPGGPHAGQALLDGGFVRVTYGVTLQVDPNGGDAWTTLAVLNGIGKAALGADILIG